jgi:hypothetical protein
MPDITVTFTDAQWARIVAASRYILPIDEGDVDAAKLAAKWKELETSNVKAYEQANASVDDF